jgi:thiosulfate oxidation carrier complex protein SoxZ
MTVVNRDRIRAKLKSGDTSVRVLLSHPMHTGRGKDHLGMLVPAEFIQDIRIWRNGIEVMTIKCGTATAANPYFSFQLAGGRVGDKIAIRWVDNIGAKGTVDTIVK